MKVKAAVCYEANQPLVVEEVELDPPQANEVLVRWAASGVCASDLHVSIQGRAGWPMPFIPGHEGAGIVESVGPGVTRVKVGDHVVADFVGACGECRFCLNGRPRLCERSRARAVPDVNSRFHKGKERIGRFGHHEIATFAEYAVIPERAAIPIRKDAPLDAACLLACCALSGASAVLHRAKVVPGSRVVVIGCGGLGLSAINAAKLSGALQIIGVDVTPQKLQWAKEFGATDVIDASREDTVKRVAELTGGLLADYAFEFVGSEETIHQTVPSVRRGGMVVVEGAPPPGTVFRIAPRELLDSEKIITGAHGGGGVPPRDVPMLLDLYMAGKFMLRDLISHRMGLKDINKAFDLMISGESKRSVIIF